MITQLPFRLLDKLQEDREVFVRRLVMSMALEPRRASPLSRRQGGGLNQRLSDPFRKR